MIFSKNKRNVKMAFTDGNFYFCKGKFFKKKLWIYPKQDDLKLIKQFLYNHGQKGILYLEDKDREYHIRFMRINTEMIINIYGPKYFGEIKLDKQESKELARCL